MIQNRQVNPDVYLCNARAGTPKRKPEPSFELGEREKQVALLISQEKGNEEIAFEMGTSLGTVKTQVYNVMQKLGAKSRVGVAVWAVKNLEARAASG